MALVLGAFASCSSTEHAEANRVDAGETGTGGAASATGSGGASSSAEDAGSASCCTHFGAATEVGQIEYSALDELSGLAASRAHPGVLYTHNDSGAGPVFYALTAAGASLAAFTLTGATATDWEDIAVGPGPSSGTFVYLGDIGDNAARTGEGTPRTEVQVYRVPEPELTTASSVGDQTLTSWQRLRFTYPDSAHDAETLLVDPVSGDILIVTKETSGASKVFRAPGSTAIDTSTVLEQVATLSLGASGQKSALATAGDISPSGGAVILRTYTAIWLFCRESSWATTFGATPTELPSATEKQGEGLAFSADGTKWYSAGESSTAIYEASATCSP